jgi:nucleolar protein 53
VYKPLKADEILSQRSVIPAIDSRKRPAESRVTDGIIEPKRQKKNGVSAKEYEKLRKIAYGGDAVHKDVVKADGDADYDPWTVQEAAPKPEFSFLEEKKAVREPRTLKRTPVSMAKSGKEIPAVRKPEAGKSYNPTFEDWNTVVEREALKAVELEQKRLEEERKELELQERIARAQAEEEKQNESAWESEWESEWEGILSEREEEPSDELLKKKRPERKTKAERNKIQRRKEEERKQLWEDKQKKREQQVAHAKALAKAFDDKEKAKAQEMAILADESSDDEEVELRRRRLGKAKIPDAPLEVVLAEELEDSLRRLKPEGNLLTDRFRSMMLRGKVETRAPIWQHKKPKRTVTEKWSYKDWRLK